MEKDGMEKEKNMIIMVNQNLKENIQMELDGMEKQKIVIIMDNQNLKEII